eukprot:EC784636.1.p3 GENE.EC784636.1~~EC784636.1.p3  ORF type:complete len:61 (-),score=4.07 EC784636.1:113-295(-)
MKTIVSRSTSSNVFGPNGGVHLDNCSRQPPYTKYSSSINPPPSISSAPSSVTSTSIPAAR